MDTRTSLHTGLYTQHQSVQVTQLDLALANDLSNVPKRCNSIAIGDYVYTLSGQRWLKCETNGVLRHSCDFVYYSAQPSQFERHDP